MFDPGNLRANKVTKNRKWKILSSAVPLISDVFPACFDNFFCPDLNLNFAGKSH